MPIGHEQVMTPDMVQQKNQSANFRRSGIFVCLLSAILLAGCATNNGTRAPVNDLTGSASTSASVKSYTVKAGDTLNKISRSTGVDENTIKRLNKLANPNRLEVGQVLKLSDGSEPVGAKPIPSNKPEAKPLDSPQSTTSNQTPARASDAGVINWSWPAKGKVIQTFTSTTRGIDIAGNEGDAVEAAASGDVAYAGNGLRGLGNLVVIKHDNGFITAYAHNRKLLVKEGQKVKAGTKIAEMGQSESPSVKLHFEVRRQGTPVDPLQYLPAR